MKRYIAYEIETGEVLCISDNETDLRAEIAEFLFSLFFDDTATPEQIEAIEALREAGVASRAAVQQILGPTFSDDVLEFMAGAAREIVILTEQVSSVPN